MACSGKLDAPTSTSAVVPSAIPVDAPPESTPSAPEVPEVIGDSACASSERVTGGLRRLTRKEINRTLELVLGDETEPANQLTPEPRSGVFDNSIETLTVSKGFLDGYVPATAQVARRFVERLDQDVPCDYAGQEAACLDAFLSTYGSQLFRAPLSPERAQQYSNLFAQLRTSSDFDAAFETMLQAMLLAPEFLYRSEGLIGRQAATDPEIARRAQWQLASALSYFITGGPPDETLRAAAEAGQLLTREQVAKQATRLLDSDIGRAGVAEFFSQMLHAYQFDQIRTDAELYPDFGSEVVEAMVQEQQTFVSQVTFEGPGTLTELFTAPYSYVPSELASIYDLQPNPVQEPTPLTERAGMFTQPGILALLAGPSTSKPVERGVWTLNTWLCTNLAPPANLDTALDPEILEADLTTRERFEQHRERPACASCHEIIDPIGYAFEHYDALGRWRDQDNGKPVDASGVLSNAGSQDGPFVGATELAHKLAQSEVVHDCVSRQLFRFGLGREELAGEQCVIDQIREQFVASELNIKQLLLAFVTSDAFIARAPTVQ